jgi:cytochrome c553
MEGTMRFKYLVAGLAVLAAVLWQVRADQEPGAKKASSADTTELIKHGDYLVNEVAGCSHCHTPHDAKGQPDRSRWLQGATLGIAPKEKTKHWAQKSPDITAGGLAGKWSEDQMIKFFTTGVNPDGEKPTPPMPAFHLNARDARAVTLYLKSLPGAKGSKQSDTNTIP